MRTVNNVRQCDDIPNAQAIPEYTLYKTVLETSMDGFCMVNKTGNIVEVNKSLCELTGYSRGELMKMNVADLEVLESNAEIEKHIILVGKVGSHNFITKHRCKNGHIIDVEVSANSIQNDHIVTFAFIRNITERIKSEGEIIKAKKDWENIFQAIGQPSLILDSKRNIIAANKATVTLAGKSEKELIGKKCYEILHKKDSHPIECPLEKILQSGSMETGEMVVEALEGTYLISCTPVFNEQNVLQKVIHIATDITERKKAEKQVMEYQKQLKQRDSEILRAEERERHRIAAGIHDDIGQRLAIIKFGLDSLQASETRSDLLVTLRRQSKLITKAIENVRSFTFQLSNPILYEIGLEAAIEAWITEHISQKDGIECKFIYTKPKLKLTEETRVILFQGVRELLMNIMKHAKATLVEIHIISRKNDIIITIKDNGIGFNYKPDTLYQKGKKGFGLFNLRERLDYLNGSLEFQKLSPNGTLAKIYIPIEHDETTSERLYNENTNSG